MSNQATPPTPEYQKRVTAELHDMLLQIFLAGVYTGFLAFLVIHAICASYYDVDGSASEYWILANPQQNRTRHIITIISVIQFGLILSGIIGWGCETVQRLMKDSFAAVLEDFSRRLVVSILWENICQFLALIIADGLIIWRCWNIWNRQAWIIVFFGLLTMIDTCLYAYVLYLMVARSKSPDLDSTALLRLTNAIGSAADFLRAGLTLLVSCCIIMRIYVLGRIQGIWKYKLVIEVIVESAVLYSLPFLVFGIYQSIIPSFDVVAGILNAIGIIIPGLAPLLLVLRIHLGLARPDSSWKAPVFTGASAQEVPPAAQGRTMQGVEDTPEELNDNNGQFVTAS